MNEKETNWDKPEEIAEQVVSEMRDRAAADGTTLEALLLHAMKTQKAYQRKDN